MADNQREDDQHSSSTALADRKERESPARVDRLRSRSPRRDRRDDKPRRKDKGFKWKDKRRDEGEPRDRDSGLQRGYRDHYRPRSRSRSPRRDRSPRHEDDSVDRKRPKQNIDDGDGKSEPKEKRKEKEKKEKKPAAAVPQQPMILVTVNDRLGTKKAIPCFASDTVRDFKIIVASMIGRQPHEILLKRQGERPFKDQLTLQDYGVSNNVQLDLEVDTGD
ncbi:uncharacterized protein HMPREF1541_01254 [Cyphellophora europaea CBS 101466]|uniref:Ubiquitin-like modifier HUB1 n=1 Tax=Cyphellophora europaea (strain CBS 101466) TaxID=1220924 RepID=W2SGQ3_CYPE1|nr:uncharacterized protein HMPREF1541_01254 [Cyphellophora europaea CBS 101466]ETN47064.1 hypothetical protein HMPREF1541_01254 [Cyphellophora europaea CBS 101466]